MILLPVFLTLLSLVMFVLLDSSICEQQLCSGSESYVLPFVRQQLRLPVSCITNFLGIPGLQANESVSVP